MGAAPGQPSHLQDAAVALVAGGRDVALGNRGLNRTIGLAEVGAVRETALSKVRGDLPEARSELLRGDRAQAELRYAGAIYKEAVRHAIEAGRRRRLPAQAVPRDVAHDRVPTQRTENRALAHARDAAQQTMAPGDRGPQALDVIAGFRIDDQRLVAQRCIHAGKLFGGRRIGEVGLRQHHKRADLFQFREGEQLVQGEQSRRRIRQRGNSDHRVDVSGHGLRPPLDSTPLQRKGAGFNSIDQRSAVFQNAHVHAIAWCEHLSLTRRALEIRNARLFLAIQHDVCRIFTNRNHARRERVRHAANDVCIVDWSRSVRIDAPSSAALSDRVAALARDGMRVRMGNAGAIPRTYALIEGPEGADPSELSQRLPEARWYDAAIIALAIEPLPADALPLLEAALGGPGAPAGLHDCTRFGSQLLVEFEPEVTPPALIMRIIDVELRRFGGSRRTQVLTPLSPRIAAAVAAQGLQAPEIASDRILETLLGLEHVE
jgi:hypothetical protein